MNSGVSNLNSNILIILPGWGGSHESWAEFVALARPHFKEVIVIDLPCFGAEPCPDIAWGVEEYAEFVYQKLATTLGSPKVLLGHSFGGAVATQLVATHPGVVDRLILSGAAIFRPAIPFRRWLFGVLAKTGGLIFRLPFLEKGSLWAKQLLYRAAKSPDYLHTSGIKRDIFTKIIRQDRSHLLPQIHTPTCVIHGTRDTYIPHASGKRVATILPKGVFVSIPDGPHGLHLKKSKELLHEIIDFLHSSYE